MKGPARLFYRNPLYDGQLVRTVSAASAQSADIGEALATARRIRRLDGASWFLEWSRTADEACRVGEEAKRSGDLVTARQAFLRASEYHRQSYYFIRSNLDDVRLQKAYRNLVEMFLAAAELMARPAIPVHIPYSGTALGGYFLHRMTAASRGQRWCSPAAMTRRPRPAG